MSFRMEEFFSRSYELHINENMFYYSYKFPTLEVSNYIETLINIPYSDFIEFVQKHVQIFPITSNDIPQFSSLDNCTINICKKLAELNDPGIKFVDIGKLLLDDGNPRNEGAYRKYGENHSKTAFTLGLTQFKESTWYLSCIGYLFFSLNKENQKAILARCLLRNRFIARIIAESEHGDVNVAKYMDCLSKSTILRRKPNVMQLINLCEYQSNLENSVLSNKFYFEIE